MSRYRKIHVKMHGDEKFCALSAPLPCGQYLWIYLLTGPQTGPIPGLFRAGEAQLAESLNWPLEGFREAFREVFLEGMAKADWKARLVFIPNAMYYNEPASPNVVKSWRVEFDELPECELKYQALKQLKAFVEGLGEAFQEAFQEAFAKPLAKTLANQEQEQEQENITGAGEREGVSSSSGRRGRNTEIPTGKKAPPPAPVSPPVFEISAKLKTWAAENVPSVDLEAELRNFQIHVQAHGKHYADWSAAFQSWLLKTPRFNRAREPSRRESAEEENERVFAKIAAREEARRAGKS